MVTQSVSHKHAAKHLLFFVSQKAIQVWNLVREASTIQHETWFCIACIICTFYLLIAHHKCLLIILTIAYLHWLPDYCCLYLFVSLSVSLSCSFCLFLCLCDHWLAIPWFWLTSLSLKSDSRHISGGITQNIWVKKLREKDHVSSLIKINSMKLVRKWVIMLVSEWFAIMTLWLISSFILVFPLLPYDS